MPNARVYSDPHYASGGPIEADLETYDANIAAGVNGDDGGSYAPASAITIGGFGLEVLGPVVFGRSAVLNASTATTVFCNDGDWPELGPLSPYATHVVDCDLAMAKGIPSYHWQARADGGIQAFSSMLDLSDGAGMRVARAVVAIRAHDHSTLSQLVVTFRVGTPHTSLPPTMPMVRVLRVDASGNAVPLTSVAAGATSDGYVQVPRPASGSAWYDSGASQSLIVVCDQNNAIDVSRYSYILEIVEEQGLQGYPWALLYKQPVSCLFHAINSVWFGSGGGVPSTTEADGLTVTTGDRVFLADQGGASGLGPALNFAGSISAYSGIWLVNASAAWSRADDWLATTDFAPGMVVPIVGGTVFGNMFAHADPNVQSWSPKATSATVGPGQGSSLTFRMRGTYVPGQPLQPTLAYPQGVIWDSAVATFQSITDLRPQ